MLNVIRERAALTRQELSRHCSLSLATAKRVVDELIALGLVEEGEPYRREGRGRKAASLRLRSEHGCAVGVSVEPSALRLRGIDFAGATVFSRELHPSTDSRGPLEELILSEARSAMQGCGDRGHLLGVGVGMAGLVNAREGVVMYCPGLPGWENVELESVLRSALGVDIVVDDIVRCMALAEKRRGAARDLETFLYVYLGAGVGSGIILDNRMYRGKHGVAGEFGHVTVKEDGPLCSCGNRGCLEAMASRGAILSRLRSLLSAGVHSTLRGASPEGGERALGDIRRAALEGDKLATMVVAETEECIGIGIANLLNIFDPGTVIVGGEIIETFGEPMLEGIRRTVARRTVHPIAQRTAVIASSVGDDAGPLGAASLVLERVLQNELLNL